MDELKPFVWTAPNKHYKDWRGQDPLGLPWTLSQSYDNQSQWFPIGPSDIYGKQVYGQQIPMSLDDAKQWCHDRFRQIIAGLFVQEDHNDMV